MKEFFTRKYGPLPMWAWIGIGVGVLYMYEKFKGSKGTPSATTIPGTQTAPPIMLLPVPSGGSGINGGATAPIIGRDTTGAVGPPSAQIGVPRSTMNSTPHQASGTSTASGVNWGALAKIPGKPGMDRKWNPTSHLWYYQPHLSGVTTAVQSMPNNPVVNRGVDWNTIIAPKSGYNRLWNPAKGAWYYSAATPSPAVSTGVANKLRTMPVTRVSVQRSVPSSAVVTGTSNKLSANPRLLG